MFNFQIHRREFLKGVGSASALMSMGAIGHAQTTLPTYYPKDYQSLIEGSKREGKLLLYSNMSPKSWAGVMQRFNALYPWIKVEILELNSDELLERYMAERGTGAPTCDFLTSGAIEKWFRMVSKGEILPYESPERKHFPAWSVPSPGLYTIAIDPLVIIYNKFLLPPDKRPNGLQSLAQLAEANPALFRGRIGVFGADLQTAGYLGHKGFTDKYGEQAWQWFGKFGPMTKSESSTGIAMEKVLSGEYVAGYFFTSGIPWQAAKDPAKSKVIGWDFVRDGQPMVIRASAIAKGARNVNSAKLWLDVTLSHEGQKGLVVGGRTPIRDDVKSSDVNGEHTYASIVAEIGEKNIMAPSFDPKQFDGQDAYVKRWRDVFARK